MADPAPSIRALFHFTDRRNLPRIREIGGLYSYAKLKEMGIEIPAPGGNDWSHDADAYKGMDNYVHLCFRPAHPMEYVAKLDGRIVSSVFLGIHTDVLAAEGVRFTAGVSNRADVETNPDVQSRLQQVEKYEILVPHHIPLKLIVNFPNG